MTIDDIDLRILDMLQRNGKLSQAKIAGAVGLTTPSVNERIKKMERHGVIKGFVALLDHDKMGFPLTAYVDVALEKKIIQKSGSYFSFGDERLGQGRQNATAFLTENPDIVQAILARIQAEAPAEQTVSARLLPQADGPGAAPVAVADEAEAEVESESEVVAGAPVEA